MESVFSSSPRDSQETTVGDLVTQNKRGQKRRARIISFQVEASSSQEGASLLDNHGQNHGQENDYRKYKKNDLIGACLTLGTVQLLLGLFFFCFHAILCHTQSLLPFVNLQA
jgi:hypothetical protein